MHLSRVPLLTLFLLIAPGCLDAPDDAVDDDDVVDDDDATDDDDTTDDDDGPSDVQIVGPDGVVLSFDPGLLPEGVLPEDLSIELDDAPPLDPPTGLGAVLSPVVHLEPVGLELLGDATLTLPVGAWAGRRLAEREGFGAPVEQALADNDIASLLYTPGLWVIVPTATEGQARGGTATNGLKLVGETLTPGVSLLMDESVTAGALHAFLGVAARALLGPLGFHLLAANSYSASPWGNQRLAGAGLVPTSAGVSGTSAVTDAAGGREERDFTGYAGYGWGLDDEGQLTAELPLRHFEPHQMVEVVLDTDANGIHDFWDGAGDVDEDGVVDAADWDNDGDRVADEAELFFDEDEDEVYALNDVDSDDDGVLDGLPDCAEGACSCGFRLDLDRVLCIEGDDLTCVDGDIGFGDAVYEVIPGTCPEPGPEQGATCTDVGGVAVHFYGEANTVAGQFFCQECVADVVPVGFCAP